jgi:hypothetical protein
LAEAPCSVSCSGRTAHRARVLRPNFPHFRHNNFSTRQCRWQLTSPLFFWDQVRIKWHITCPPSHLNSKVGSKMAAFKMATVEPMSHISCIFTNNHYILRARCVRQAVRGIKGC